jgi:hypothetical protein
MALGISFASRLDWIIDAGSDWTRTVAFTVTSSGAVIPLTGYTARAKMVDVYGGTVLATFTCVVDEPNGTVTLSLTDVETAIALGENYPWDLELIDGSGNVERTHFGRVEVRGEATT